MPDISDPRGRQPIGVNQPQGGSDYPLAGPVPESVRYLLADFYLAYPGGAACDCAYPLRIRRLAGFGEEAAELDPGWAVHDYDVLIEDDLGHTIFDSTQATDFQTSVWDDRLLVIEWLTDAIVCRCVIHTAWTAEDIADGLTLTYSSDFDPNVVLDPRTYVQLPDRVTSLNGISAQEVVLSGGYNTALAVVDPETSIETALSNALAELAAVGGKIQADGTRQTCQVQLDCRAGLGQGRAPSCTEEADTGLSLRYLGGAGGDASGQLRLDGKGTLRIQRPVTLSCASPRQFRYTNAATLAIANDGQACCTCDQYARVYKGLKRQWGLWYDLAQRAYAARDGYNANRYRWDLARTQIRESSLHVVGFAEEQCKLQAGATFCNTTACCLTDVVLRFTFLVQGTPYADAPVFCQGKLAGTHTCNEEVGLILADTWPVYDVPFASLDPGGLARASFRLCVPQCTDLDPLRLVVTAHFPASFNECHFPINEAIDPALLTALETAWGGADGTVHALQEPADLIALDDSNPFLNACECA